MLLHIISMNGISYNVTKNRSSRLPESSICIARVE